MPEYLVHFERESDGQELPVRCILSAGDHLEAKAKADALIPAVKSRYCMSCGVSYWLADLRDNLAYLRAQYRELLDESEKIETASPDEGDEGDEEE